MSDSRLVYRVEEVAELLGCGRSTVYDAIERNELPGVLRLGRRILVSKAALHTALGLTPADTELLGGDVGRINENGTGAVADPVETQETSEEVTSRKPTRPI